MSDRIAAAASQATPEQIRAAHAALSVCGELLERTSRHAELITAIRAALPPLPEPERPRITAARELARRTFMGGVDGHFNYSNVRVEAILARDAEIIAWLEWEHERCQTCTDKSYAWCERCNAFLDLGRTIREADIP